MRPATWPRDRAEDERLMIVDAAEGSISHERVGDLPSYLRAGDVVVVNDAATLPASVEAATTDGRTFELRPFGGTGPEMFALALGAGDSAMATEARGDPPELAPGDRIAIGGAEVLEVLERVGGERRLLYVRAVGSFERFLRALYRAGKPVQYAYVAGPLSLYHVQTPWASRPWAAEMPCAGRPLGFGLLGALRRRGVVVGRLTHAAGLSSTGEASADARLPLPERYEIPEATAVAIASARESGGRVVAIGTTVARALEDAHRVGGGTVRPGAAEARLVLGAASERGVVDALLTGIHEPATSHFRLLEAFAPRSLLDRSIAEAEREGYLLHEFGDSMLVVARTGGIAAAA